MTLNTRRVSIGFLHKDGDLFHAFAKYADVRVDATGATADEALENAKRELEERFADQP